MICCCLDNAKLILKLVAKLRNHERVELVRKQELCFRCSNRLPPATAKPNKGTALNHFRQSKPTLMDVTAIEQQR